MSVAYGPRVSAEDLLICLDPNNIKCWSPNIHPNPINIHNWVSTAYSCTLSKDPTTTDSPVNGTPLKMVVTSSDPHIQSTNTYLSPAAQGETWTVSVYAKASTNTSGELYILGLNSANNWIEAPNQAISITTSWKRFSFTATLANPLTVGIAVRLDGPNSGYANDGITVPTIWWDGIQVEKRSSASSFSPIVNNQVRTAAYDLSLNKNNSVLQGGSSNNSSVYPKTFDTNTNSVTVSNYISTPTLTFPDASGYTFDFWVKLNPSALATFHSLSGRLSVSPWISIYTTDTTGNNWYLSFRELDLTYRNFSNITDWNIKDNWTNVIITTDSARNVNFYLNGNLRQTVSSINSTFFEVKAIMGGYLSGSNYYSFQGSLGMAKIYNKTLSDLEVKQSFSSVRSRFGIA